MISQIPPEDCGRFEKFIARFRDRWNAEFSGPLAANTFDSCLPAAGDSLRRSVLLEIVAIDLVTRLDRGQQSSLPSYVQLFPELGPPSQLPIELLEIEFLHRKHSTSPVTLDEYLALFPAHAVALRKRLEGHNADFRGPMGGTLIANLDGAALIQPILPTSSAAEEFRRRERKVSAEESLEEKSQNETPEDFVPRQPPSVLGSEAISTTRVVSLESGYRMIRRIGRGNFGEVWLSEAPGGVEVALKIVRIPTGQRIREKEIRSLDLMKRMRHPFLMQVQAFWILDEQIVIAMELGDKSLRDLARDNNNILPQAELIRYMSEAAEGIDYLHREHVVHRDIKPENLLLLKNHVKVADFGLARLMDESGWSVDATQVAGSPLYMAPEGWAGKPVPASDQYSLAMSYCVLRMGRAPFESSSVAAVMHEHLHGQPQFHGLPVPEQEVLIKALAKLPDERYESCTEMVRALAQTLADATASNQKLTASRGHTWYGALVGAFGAIVLAGILLFQFDFFVFNPDPSPAKSQILMREKLDIACGESKNVEISLINSSEPLMQVQTVSLPVGIKLNFSRDASELTLTAAIDAPLGKSILPIKFATTHEEFAKDLHIEVVESSRLRVPGRTEVSMRDTRRSEWDERIYYERIEFPLPSGERIEFILIPRKTTDYPNTFYIMKQEVSNRWFAEFAAANPDQVRSDAPWRQGALTEKHLGIDGDLLDFPVVHVNASEANAFAEWVGGKLPSVKQWEAAAGLLENNGDSDGPYRLGGTQIGINRIEHGPGKCGFWPDDISVFGLVDLAGNVRELTRSMLSSSNEVPLKNSLETDRVLLLGNGFREREPWNFPTENDNDPTSLRYEESRPDVGFRVAIEL